MNTQTRDMSTLERLELLGSELRWAADFAFDLEEATRDGATVSVEKRAQHGAIEALLVHAEACERELAYVIATLMESNPDER